VTEQEADAASQRLVDTAREYGVKKATALMAERNLKRVKALAMKASSETSAAAQEREAYASDQYKAAMDAEWKATVEFETLKAEREGLAMRVDFWRSVNARQRGA
jgi:hypothetical protein